jgi:hypothetical protein
VIEDAQAILDYLPSEYKTAEEQEYTSFLWDNFQSNYETGKYQFAYIAYHMLFMCFTYYSVWKLKTHRGNDFEKSVIHFNNEICKKLFGAAGPLEFAEIESISESRIFRFFKLAGCGNSEIGEFTSVVNSRNAIAHANGHIFYKTSDALDEQLEKIVICMEKIQASLNCVLDDIFKKFLMERSAAEFRETFEDSEQIREFLIRENYLSPKDIERCLQFDTSSLSSHPDFPLIETMFNSFKSLYQPILTWLLTEFPLSALWATRKNTIAHS